IATPTHHFSGSGPGRGSPWPASTRVSMSEPSRLARIRRMPSRSHQYSFLLVFSSCSCLGVNVPPSGTIVLRFCPSRSARSMEPSFAAGFPMLVQKMCPAATSTATPSGYLQSVTMTLRSEPSGFSETTRSLLSSRRNKRPIVRSPDARFSFEIGELTICLNSRYSVGSEPDTEFTAVRGNSIVEQPEDPVDVFGDRDPQKDFVHGNSRRETPRLDFRRVPMP